MEIFNRKEIVRRKNCYLDPDRFDLTQSVEKLVEMKFH